MDKILYAHSGEIAGLIIEPLIQAAGGMITSPPGYLRGVRELCSKYDILMIADEVATGFGRTGKMFACAHEQVLPDIMCLSKGITGGYMPLAVTLATDDIYNAFLGEFKDLKTFFHGHSYTGNPLACAAALACLDLFDKEKVLEGLQSKIGMLDEWLRELLTLPHVGDVRHAGFMAGVELVRDKATKEPYAWEEKVGWKVAYHARDNGVFIRPLGNVIVIMPPLSISEQNLETIAGSHTVCDNERLFIMSRKTIILLLILFILPLVIYFLWPSDEARIKKLFREGAKAIEKKDLDAVMSKVSFNYTDEYGFNYLYIKESMKRVFQQMGDIDIDYENLTITVTDKAAKAEMDVRVVATIGSERGYILGDLPNPVHLTFSLEKQRTKWMVTKAEGMPFKW